MSENELKATEENIVSEETKALEENTVSEETAVAEEAVTVEETVTPEETKVSEEKPAEEEAVSSDEIPSEADSGKKIFAKGKKNEKKSVTNEVLDWLRTICIGVLAGVFIVVFLVQRDDVYGSSMMPTLSSGDVVYTEKISTYFNTYKRGDIVVLDGSGMEGYTKTEYLIKRVVGLPGETVRIADGCVYIKPADSNEFYLLQENYLPEGTKTVMMDDGLRKGYDEITLGEDEYYCLGDNRPVSNDSRNLGPFNTKRIKGVAVIRVFPLNEIKVL